MAERATKFALENGDMATSFYHEKAGLLLKEYIVSERFSAYTSVVIGIFFCKIVYDSMRLVSPVYFKSYSGLSRMQRTEWNNRAISTLHAIFITAISLFFVFRSDLYSDYRDAGSIILRSSTLSTFALGVSVGYFLTDLSMIVWLFPSLGGMEYVFHHILSLAAVAYAMITREGQLYTYMVLISEMTTPGINLRWYLDTSGMKRSKAYIINGIGIFLTWMVARIFLFIYLFYHIYEHYEEVRRMQLWGLMLVSLVPMLLSVMNLMWFHKIVKGLKKTLAKTH